MNFLATALLAFILGTVIGSFLNVVIHRFGIKQSIIKTRSICPKCKEKLKPQYLVPIFSWLFLKGRCGYCNAKISPSYLLTELVTGFTYVAIFVNFGLTMQSLLLAIVTTFLILIFFYDLKTMEIPDHFSLPAIAFTVAGGLTIGTPTPLDMLYGTLTIGGFFALQFILSRGTWIGGGDIRLGALIGALLGLTQGILATTLAYLIGGIISTILLLTGRASRKSQLPFGPFLVIGTLTTIFFGPQILDWYFTLLGL